MVGTEGMSEIKLVSAKSAKPKAKPRAKRGSGSPRASRKSRIAKFGVGSIVRHRFYPFRGVVFDVDAMFSNTDAWYQNIPEDARPPKNQPFYHLLAENDESYYVAYVSEQNLVPDETGQPVTHPDLPDLFGDFEDGRYPLQFQLN